MATPIRKKRNFKALQLNVAEPPPPPPEPEVVKPIMPTRPAPVAGGKKRPPPMTLKAPKIPPSNAPAVEQDTSLLAVSQGPSSAPLTATTPSARRMTYHTTLTNTLAQLDMNAEIKFDLRNEDLKEMQELGQGNGGSVKKVEHIPTGTFMAKKVSTASI